MEIDVDAFWRDGFTIIRGVYTEEEIAEIRRDAMKYENEHVGDLLTHPALGGVITDGRMAEVARAILGRNDIVYYGDTKIAIRDDEGGRGWHKDNADRNNPKAPDWRGAYTQLRFGIYTQDHAEHSGGLNVRAGSHDVCDHRTGRVVHIPSRVGDLSVWSMRITHSANGVLLREGTGRYRMPGPKTATEIDPSLVLPPADGKRVVLFSALGAKDDHYRRYVTYLKTRAYAVEQWRASEYSDEMIESMADTGIEVRDVRKEILDDPSAGANVLWHAIPFEPAAKPQKPAPAKAAPAKAAPAKASARPQPVPQPMTASRALKGAARRTRKAVRALAGH